MIGLSQTFEISLASSPSEIIFLLLATALPLFDLISLSSTSWQFSRDHRTLVATEQGFFNRNSSKYSFEEIQQIEVDSKHDADGGKVFRIGLKLSHDKNLYLGRQYTLSEETAKEGAWLISNFVGLPYQISKQKSS